MINLGTVSNTKNGCVSRREKFSSLRHLNLKPNDRILPAIIAQASLLLMACAGNSSFLPIAGSILMAAISLLGICYTKQERLEVFIRTYDLPENINTRMTRELADNIALPFERLFNIQIETLLADPADQTITTQVDTSEETSVRVNDLVIEETLLPMLGEINRGELKFDINTFPEQFTERVAKKMKESYFADQPITIEQITSNINTSKIQGRTLGRNVAVWVQRHNLVPNAKRFGLGSMTTGSQTAKRRG
jgi:hypothetical protein